MPKNNCHCTLTDQGLQYCLSMLLISDMHDLNGALFLKVNFLSSQLFSFLPSTVISPFKTINFKTLFPGGTIISSTFLEFSAGKGFGFTILPAILFPIDSPVPSAALWTTFLEVVFRASSPVLVAVSNKCLPYLLDRFLANEKNPDPLMHFLVLASIE